MFRSIAVLNSRRFIKLQIWARRVNLGRKLAFVLGILSLLAGIGTYAALTGYSSIGSDPRTVLAFLITDLVLLLLFGAVLARNLVRLWVERKKGGAASRLHVRLVLLFSLVTMVPAIVVAVFSVMFFNMGVEGWFNQRVKTAISASQEVAQAYLKEHRQIIAGDALAMANDLNREFQNSGRNSRILSAVVENQALLRGLTEVVVFEANGKVLSKYGYTFSLQFEPVPLWAMERSRLGEVVVLTSENDDRIRALVQLNGVDNAFLYVGRFVDAKVLSFVEQAKKAAREYERLEGKRFNLELTFSAIFLVVALLLLMVAVWLGFMLASRLASPIMALIAATERLGEGDLHVRVEETAAADELGTLSRTFNRMANQMESQRDEILAANRELEQRRIFTETVLSGVSAGVIGLDGNGLIHLFNRSAVELLGEDLNNQIGKPLTEFLEESVGIFENLSKKPEKVAQEEIKVNRNGSNRVLLARLTAESVDSQIIGYVLTFDDITDLQAAERKAAWADVARRIAHEIKNPLTPIQLSAERLKRKYLKEITSDKEIFTTCTDTIIRQVGDIGRMVDEFSDFARMPAPVLKKENLGEIIHQVIFLQRNAFPKIRHETILPEPMPWLYCDSRLLNRLLINILKNAAEAIEGKGENITDGQICLEIQNQSNQLLIIVTDNGRGLPKEERERLTEPYVTTRSKGTGLGLAIVKKIMEDHNGKLILDDCPETGGAKITLVFPVKPDE